MDHEGEPTADATKGRYLAAPLWAVLVLPFGLTTGYASIAVPYVLRQRQVDMATIGLISAVCSMPHAVKLLWAPALDAGWRRRSWYVGSVALTALFLALTSVIPPSASVRFGPVSLLTLYTVVLTLGQTAVATSTSAVLALMATTLPNEVKGRASGWQTAGNLVGATMGGGLATWLVSHLAPAAVAAILAVATVACALPAFFIHEPAPEKHRLSLLLGDLVRSVWASLRSREGWTGLVICLSPVGTGAMTNLFSALAQDYVAQAAEREHLVVIVNGVFGGLASAAGALLGGYVVDRVNRRIAYVVFGGMTALSAIGMLVSPASSLTFTVGSLAYFFTNGLCFAAFYAFVLEMVGKGSGVTTKLALYIGASNVAINYVTWFDGLGYDAASALFGGHEGAGRRGMLGTDALSSVVGIAILAAMLLYLRRRGPEAAPSAA